MNDLNLKHVSLIGTGLLIAAMLAIGVCTAASAHFTDPDNPVQLGGGLLNRGDSADNRLYVETRLAADTPIIIGPQGLRGPRGGIGFKGESLINLLPTPPAGERPPSGKATCPTTIYPVYTGEAPDGDQYCDLPERGTGGAGQGGVRAMETGATIDPDTEYFFVEIWAARPNKSSTALLVGGRFHVNVGDFFRLKVPDDSTVAPNVGQNSNYENRNAIPIARLDSVTYYVQRWHEDPDQVAIAVSNAIAEQASSSTLPRLRVLGVNEEVPDTDAEHIQLSQTAITGVGRDSETWQDVTIAVGPTVQAPDDELDLLTATTGETTFTVREPGIYLVTWRGEADRFSNGTGLMFRLATITENSGVTTTTEYLSGEVILRHGGGTGNRDDNNEIIDETKIAFIGARDTTVQFQVTLDHGASVNRDATISQSFLIWVKLEP